MRLTRSAETKGAALKGVPLDRTLSRQLAGKARPGGDSPVPNTVCAVWAQRRRALAVLQWAGREQAFPRSKDFLQDHRSDGPPNQMRLDHHGVSTGRVPCRRCENGQRRYPTEVARRPNKQPERAALSEARLFIDRSQHKSAGGAIETVSRQRGVR